jgi:hypothetical protein
MPSHHRQAIVTTTALLGAVVFLAACASRKPQTAEQVTTETWQQGGTNLGTITTVPKDFGCEMQYRDLSRKLVRVEKRDASRQLLSGPCILTISHTPLGQPLEEEHFDAYGELTNNEKGYATRRWVHQPANGQESVVEESFYDAAGQRANTADGFGMIRTTLRPPGGNLRRIQFFDKDGQPATTTYEGVSGVAEVKFVQLQGLGEISCASYLDASGHVLARKHLGGVVASHSETSYTSTYYYHYYPTYYHARPYYHAVPASSR